MSLEYGVIDTRKLGLPLPSLLDALEKSVAEFSYDFAHPPDFRSLFVFISMTYTECNDLELLRRATDLIANIASYKLGTYVADIFTQPVPIILKLLSSHSVAHLKSAVDYFRKIARAIGPRAVIEKFIEPHTENEDAQRGLAIIAHQIVLDFPDFPFVAADFGDWAVTLSGVVGAGPRLANLVKERVSIDVGDVPSARPPSVPVAASHSGNQILETLAKKSSAPHPKSAKPPIPRRILGKKAETDTSVMFKMTNRQQQVREFIDEPFGRKEKVSDLIAQMRDGVGNKEWEERSASYNLARRLIKYASDEMSDDDIHCLVTAVLDDISSPRAALALSAIGALEEGFTMKPETMEFELARVMSVMIKLHQKTAQFFEAALSHCFEEIVQAMPPKRFVSVLMSNGETRSTKVQSAIARYLRDSLRKCLDSGDKLFTRNSNDASELVKFIYKLMSGAATETRDAAKAAARCMSDLYGDAFGGIVSHALESRDANEFLRAM